MQTFKYAVIYNPNACSCPNEAAYLLWLIFYDSSFAQQYAALFDCGFFLILLRWGV